MTPALLDGFTVTVTFPVAWGEMDAMGHVNNTVYFRYFETVSYTHLRAHETVLDLVCRLLLVKKTTTI